MKTSFLNSKSRALLLIIGRILSVLTIVAAIGFLLGGGSLPLLSIEILFVVAIMALGLIVFATTPEERYRFSSHLFGTLSWTAFCLTGLAWLSAVDPHPPFGVVGILVLSTFAGSFISFILTLLGQHRNSLIEEPAPAIIIVK